MQFSESNLDFASIAAQELRAAIIDSVEQRESVTLAFTFSYDSSRVGVSRATQQKSSLDLQPTYTVNRSKLTIPEETLARNFKRAKGVCRKNAEAIIKGLDSYTIGILSITFKAGQVCEVERRYRSQYSVAADQN